VRPEDVLQAIGEVDDAYIKKAHRKSLLTALLVFAVIVAVGCAIAYHLLPDQYLQLRYYPDASVVTGYPEPEALIYDDWTSVAYTAYQDGQVRSTTEFQRALFTRYKITHSENGETKQIIGANADALWPKDYLGSRHYQNLYLSTMYATDLLNRVDMVFINSETAYGVLNQLLNCVTLEYLERSDRVLRQTQVANGGTQDETVLSTRGYSYQNDKIIGWKEWAPEGNLLSYADYTYDGNTQTAATYLADGTLAGTRVSKYSFGKLRWREYYDPDGTLTGKEVYRYRAWEVFFSLEGAAAAVVIVSLAATMGIAVWDDRIRLGDRLVMRKIPATQNDTLKLMAKVDSLRSQVAKLSQRLENTEQEEIARELAGFRKELEEMNELLGSLLKPPREDP